MIRNYEPSGFETASWYELTFDDGRGNGCVFPCDENGKLIATETTNPAAIENYKWCLEHPEKFFRFNKIIRRERTYRTNPTGTCRCGQKIELYNQYLGACECPRCGQWYNLSGQELLKPDHWGLEYEDPDEAIGWE